MKVVRGEINRGIATIDLFVAGVLYGLTAIIDTEVDGYEVNCHTMGGIGVVAGCCCGKRSFAGAQDDWFAVATQRCAGTRSIAELPRSTCSWPG